jgi:hypothetical protein
VSERSPLNHDAWIEAICLGVLDYMLVLPEAPVSKFHCAIKQMNFHLIDSSRTAFRLAGRYAAKKALTSDWVVI